MPIGPESVRWMVFTVRSTSRSVCTDIKIKGTDIKVMRTDLEVYRTVETTHRTNSGPMGIRHPPSPDPTVIEPTKLQYVRWAADLLTIPKDDNAWYSGTHQL